MPDVASGMTLLTLFALAELFAGTDHNCALRTDGTAECWGCNHRGQLGDGTDEDRAGRVVVKGLRDAHRLSLGVSHSCAVTRNGRVICWGGWLAPTSGAMEIPNLTGITNVAATRDGACALRDDGKVLCWGRHQFMGWAPELATRPVVVGEAHGVFDVVDLHADLDDSVCVLRRDASLLCWGRLGDLTMVPPTDPGYSKNRMELGKPHRVMTDVVRFVPDAQPICVQKRSGDVVCPALWGAVRDELMNPLPRDAAQLAIGWRHACAVHRDGRVRCWGRNGEGQLGVLQERAGTAVVVPGVAARQVVVGALHTCALGPGDRVTCWGTERHSVLGDGTSARVIRRPLKNELRLRRVPRLRDIVALDVGEGELPCAVDRRGRVFCRGEARWERVKGLGDVVEVSTGRAHACARRRDGSVWCWGEYYFGPQNHDADEDDFLRLARPRRVDGVRARRIASMEEGDCAVAEDDSVHCWGRPHGKSLSAFQVDESAAGGTNLASARERTCALGDDGAVRCWGTSPILGDGTDEARAQPVAVVDLPAARQVATGSWFTCALAHSGSVHCWGDNESGQLGDGTRRERNRPARVKGIADAVAIAADSEAAYALRADGSVWVWGNDDE